MRLCFYIDTMNGGGAERVMSLVVNSLSEEHDVFLITDTSKPILYEIALKVHVVNYKEGFPAVKKNITNKIWRRIWLYQRYRTIALELHADVVVSFKTLVNCDTLLSFLFSGIPVICSEHTNILRKRPFSWRLKRNLLYPSASAITVLTQYDLRQKCCKRWKTVRMPNPCIIKPFYTSSPRQKIVFTAGRVDDWNVKGYDLLLKAWGKICSKYPDWKLQVAGNYTEPVFQKLNDLAIECGCLNYEFLGYRKDVEDYMKTVSVYCLSSRIEGLPMGLIEAMNSGCCCVAFNCITGPNEIIKDGYSGLLAEAGNVDDLSDKLSKVMSDETLRSSLSSHAQESVSCYSIDKVMEQWNALFKKVIK